MDLTPAQRKAFFGLIVVALIGLGCYIFVSAGHGTSGGASPAASRSPAPGVAPAAPPASQGPGPSATPSAPDIYQWLPFTQSELGSAAAVVTQFCAAYATWSYSQDGNAFAASMGNLITSQLSQVLAAAYSVPGVAAQRAAKKQVSTGSGTIDSLRAFGPSSMTFVVTITQRITATSGRSQASGQYAVTVDSAGVGWQVNDIELASAGNP